MSLEFSVGIEKDSEGSYVASVPALPECHTQARSLDESMERVREAIELCIDERGDELEAMNSVGVQRITIAARHAFRDFLGRCALLKFMTSGTSPRQEAHLPPLRSEWPVRP